MGISAQLVTKVAGMAGTEPRAGASVLGSATAITKI